MEQSEQSVEDWAGDLVFGQEQEPEEVEDQEIEASDESDDDTEEESDDKEVEAKDEKDEPEYVEVEYEGDIYEVPPKLKDALMRDATFTQKTQEVSAQRKQVEAERALIKQARDGYEFVNSVQNEVSQVQQIDSTIPQVKQYLRENIDSLSSTEIEKIRFQIDELQTQRQAIQQSLTQKYQSFQQAQEQSRKELLDKSTEVLRSKYPDWNGDEVVEYAKSLGFAEDQVAIAQQDPKQMELVRKAMLYDRLQEGKGRAVAKVKSAPQIKQKSRNPMPKDVQDKLNMRKQLKNPRKSNAEKASLIGESIRII